MTDSTMARGGGGHGGGRGGGRGRGAARWTPDAGWSGEGYDAAASDDAELLAWLRILAARADAKGGMAGAKERATGQTVSVSGRTLGWLLGRVPEPRRSRLAAYFRPPSIKTGDYEWPAERELVAPSPSFWGLQYLRFPAASWAPFAEPSYVAPAWDMGAADGGGGDARVDRRALAGLVDAVIMEEARRLGQKTAEAPKDFARLRRDGESDDRYAQRMKDLDRLNEATKKAKEAEDKFNKDKSLENGEKMGEAKEDEALENYKYAERYQWPDDIARKETLAFWRSRMRHYRDIKEGMKQLRREREPAAARGMTFVPPWVPTAQPPAALVAPPVSAPLPVASSFAWRGSVPPPPTVQPLQPAPPPSVAPSFAWRGWPQDFAPAAPPVATEAAAPSPAVSTFSPWGLLAPAAVASGIAVTGGGLTASFAT